MRAVDVAGLARVRLRSGEPALAATTLGALAGVLEPGGSRAHIGVNVVEVAGVQLELAAPAESGDDGARAVAPVEICWYVRSLHPADERGGVLPGGIDFTVEAPPRGLDLVPPQWLATLKIAVHEPQEAAARVAALVRGHVSREVEPHRNWLSYAVALAGHQLAFIGSRSGSHADLVGRVLAEDGERAYCLSFETPALPEVRQRLADAAIPFSQWGARALTVDASVTRCLEIEFRAR
jgi:hypothetical protein